MTLAHDTRGVAPGWRTPRHWRGIMDVFSSGGNCQRANYETTPRDRPERLPLVISSRHTSGVIVEIFRLNRDRDASVRMI
jgi:hypothetical protein